jgi:hypothetical protein
MASDRHACRLRSPGLSDPLSCGMADSGQAGGRALAHGALARLSPSRPQGREHYLSSPRFGDEGDVSQWAVAWVDGGCGAGHEHGEDER